MFSKMAVHALDPGLTVWINTHQWANSTSNLEEGLGTTVLHQLWLRWYIKGFSLHASLTTGSLSLTIIGSHEQSGKERGEQENVDLILTRKTSWKEQNDPFWLWQIQHDVLLLLQWWFEMMEHQNWGARAPNRRPNFGTSSSPIFFGVTIFEASCYSFGFIHPSWNEFTRFRWQMKFFQRKVKELLFP